jgi:regulator of nucleoside diphosphate kinase
MDHASWERNTIDMERKIIVTVNDYNRLMSLVEFGELESKMPNAVLSLFKNLSAAKKLPPENIEQGIVTMNSKVRLKDIKSRRETEVTVTYPHDADPRKRNISVLSSVGLALLGRREQDIVSWAIPSGVGSFEIVKVTYQPEAAGHFYL